MLLLLASACGYASYYPSTNGYWGVFDTADGSSDLPCGAPTSESVTMHAVDLSPEPLVLWQRLGDCSEVVVDALPEGRPLDVPAAAGGVYVARRADESLYTWTTIPSGSPEYTWEIR